MTALFAPSPFSLSIISIKCIWKPGVDRLARDYGLLCKTVVLVLGLVRNVLRRPKDFHWLFTTSRLTLLHSAAPKDPRLPPRIYGGASFLRIADLRASTSIQSFLTPDLDHVLARPLKRLFPMSGSAQSLPMGSPMHAVAILLLFR